MRARASKALERGRRTAADERPARAHRATGGRSELASGVGARELSGHRNPRVVDEGVAHRVHNSTRSKWGTRTCAPAKAGAANHGVARLAGCLALESPTAGADLHGKGVAMRAPARENPYGSRRSSCLTASRSFRRKRPRTTGLGAVFSGLQGFLLGCRATRGLQWLWALAIVAASAGGRTPLPSGGATTRLDRGGVRSSKTMLLASACRLGGNKRIVYVAVCVP